MTENGAVQAAKQSFTLKLWYGPVTGCFDHGNEHRITMTGIPFTIKVITAQDRFGSMEFVSFSLTLYAC